MISYNLVHNNLNIHFIKLEINYSTPKNKLLLKLSILNILRAVMN